MGKQLVSLIRNSHPTTARETNGLSALPIKKLSEKYFTFSKLWANNFQKKLK
jgi:hypothetical protein